MDCARIFRENEPIELAEWQKLIDELEYLEQAPPRSGINPFTKEVYTSSGEGAAFVLQGEKKLGVASLYEGEIITSGVPMNACEDIAKRFGAKVVVID